MAEIVDYIVYMTYDFYGQWDYSNVWAQEVNTSKGHLRCSSQSDTFQRAVQLGIACGPT
jgi:GH18 family chitinase